MMAGAMNESVGLQGKQISSIDEGGDQEEAACQALLAMAMQDTSAYRWLGLDRPAKDIQ